MKVIEIMKLGRNFLEMLQNSCIRMNDMKYIEMYEEYEAMVSIGEKISYVATTLSNKYRISERQFYYLIKRFGKDCKDLAAG
ncbi:MAG: hypothetical protein IJQ13_04550 [Prevotella sp.]|nr:hypothetical protein [Prevotella sp.]